MIRLFEHRSLEKEIILPLREYIESIGFPDKFPNFGKIRISTAHPFAVLLFNSVVRPGTVPDTTNLFPSITIADSYSSEPEETIGRDYAEGVLSSAGITTLINNENVIVSDEKIQSVAATIEATGPVPYRKWTMVTQRNLDFNIWGENHDIVSIIYDMVESFAIINTRDEDAEYTLHGSVTGRRSGDINVEFGKQLYGANVTIPLAISRDVMELDTDIPYPVTATIANRKLDTFPITTTIPITN